MKLVDFIKEDIEDRIRNDLKLQGPRRYPSITGRLRRFIETNMSDVEIVEDGLDQVIRFKKEK